MGTRKKIESKERRKVPNRVPVGQVLLSKISEEQIIWNQTDLIDHRS